MTPSILATVHDRQVIVPVSDEIPDGTRVEVRVVPVVAQVGVSESQWGCDAAAMKEWNEWLESIEPVEFAPTSNFDQEFQKSNVDAVREQMFGGER